MGAAARRLTSVAVEPSVSISLSWDDLDDHLAGRDRAHDLLADRFETHGGDEILHHLQGDVGFEQRQTHFTQRRIDVGPR